MGMLLPRVATIGAIHPRGRTQMIRKSLCALALCLAMVLPAIAASPVNVNTANAKTLAASLDGVGLGKAQAIVAYRDAHGPFKSIDELGKVKGIGAKTLARNRDTILLDDGTSDPQPSSSAEPAHKARKH
jgi:competence protein ComEA